MKASCDTIILIVENLTAQQKNLLEMLLKGIPPKEIAFNLNISYNTFLYHQKQLYRKLDVHSVQELFAKYATEVNSEVVNELAPEGENNVLKNALSRKWQLPLIGILTVAVVLLFILTFTRKPVGGIPQVKNGHVVKTHSYDKIHLEVNRWGDPSDNPNNNYGEQWSDNSHRIKLLDLCSLADIKDGMKIKLNGTIDKDIRLCIMIFKVSSKNNNWTWIGGNYPPFLEVKSGSFEETIEIYFPDSAKLNNDDLGELIIVQLNNMFWAKNGDKYSYYYGSIPDNIPNGTVMATISNLTISIVSK